jgi:hypothetical protein
MRSRSGLRLGHGGSHPRGVAGPLVGREPRHGADSHACRTPVGQPLSASVAAGAGNWARSFPLGPCRSRDHCRGLLVPGAVQRGNCDVALAGRAGAPGNDVRRGPDLAGRGCCAPGFVGWFPAGPRAGRRQLHDERRRARRRGRHPRPADRHPTGAGTTIRSRDTLAARTSFSVVRCAATSQRCTHVSLVAPSPTTTALAATGCSSPAALTATRRPPVPTSCG